MTIVDTTQAASFVTDVTTTITNNMPGLFVILGAAIGVTVAFGLMRFGLAKLSGSWRS